MNPVQRPQPCHPIDGIASTSAPQKGPRRVLPRNASWFDRTTTVARARHIPRHVRALQSPSDGLDVETLRQEASRLGLPKDAGERLVTFANMLAAQSLLSNTASCLRAEARYGQAEAARATALERVLVAENKSYRLETIANKRYMKLLELRGSVNLRDELKDVLSEGAAALVTEKRERRQPRPSALEKWTYLFHEAAQGEFAAAEKNLLDCCRAADSRLGSAEKAAVAMVRIIENLDQRVHRSLPAEVITRIGGVAIEESALLGTQDCKLVECVMKWAAKPCRIVSQEEIERLMDEEMRRTPLPTQADTSADGTIA